MHTGSAEYTTFITSELINRESGSQATRIAVFKKTKKGKETTEREQPIANDGQTCPTDWGRGGGNNRVNKFS